MTRPCGDALVLITSQDPDNSQFGTGFAICERGGDTIALTCAHVVVEVGGPDHVRADKDVATVVAQGDPDSADIAVLRLPARTGRAVLKLGAEAEAGDLFDTTGFQRYGHRTLLRNLNGRLSGKVALAYRGTGTRVDAWDIDIISARGLQPGYSGAPVVGPDGRVVGIITDRQGDHAGLAISVGCLNSVWKEMPDGCGPPKKPAARLVTNREYLDFVRSSGHRKPLHWTRSHPPFPDELREVPVTGISWDDAIDYCDWLGTALPGPIPGSAPGAERPSGRNHGIAEWYDAGSEDRKEVRDPQTGVLVDLVARGARRQDIGFRCIPPHATSPPTWVLIEQGRYELGTDVPSFGRIAATSGLPIDLRTPILGRPVRRLDLDEFKISATCVTNEEFFSFTRHNGARWPPGWSARWLDRSGFPFPARLASQPVVNVSAEEAQAYCVWSRTRLPSWAEWERAAAGPQRRPYPWGADYDSQRCNSSESGRGALAAANAYPDGDTPEGARQLCGNVAEWAVGPSGGFETRGGSYRMSCEIWGLTYAFRQAEPGSRAPDIGFRVVSD